MTTRIVRVGNTLTVEIPEELVAAAALPIGEPMEWVSDGKGRVTLVESSTRPAATPFREITIEELLEGVEEGASLGEYDWGPRRGAEFW